MKDPIQILVVSVKISTVDGCKVNSKLQVTGLLLITLVGLQVVFAIFKRVQKLPTVMSFKKQIDIIDHIDFHIQHRSTGTPTQLARKVGISKRAVHYYIKMMKDEFDAPIKYDAKKLTYKYHLPVKFTIGYQKKSS